MSADRAGCGSARDRLVDLAYGEISGAEADEVRAHVEACPACREELDGIMRVRSIVSASRQLDVPSGLEARVMSEAREALAAREPAAAGSRAVESDGGSGLRGWLAGLLRPSVLRPAIATAATVLLIAGVVWMVGVRDRGVVDRYTDRGELSGPSPGIGAPPAPPLVKTETGTQQAPAVDAQATAKSPQAAVVDEGPATLAKLAKKDVATKSGGAGLAEDLPADEKKNAAAKAAAGPIGGAVDQGASEKAGADKTLAKEADEDDLMSLLSPAPAGAGGGGKAASIDVAKKEQSGYTAAAGDLEEAPPAKGPAAGGLGTAPAPGAASTGAKGAAAVPSQTPLPTPLPAPAPQPPSTAGKQAPTAPSPAKPAPSPAAAPPAEKPQAAAGGSAPATTESKAPPDTAWYPAAEGGESGKKKKGKSAEAEKSVAYEPSPAPATATAQDSVAMADEAQEPSDPFDQAMAAKKDKDWKGAVAILKPLKDNPSATSAPQAKVYHELAICTAAAGSKQKALVIYENLFARFPDYAGRYQAMWEAAGLYIEIGDKAGAKALLTQLEQVPAWQKKAKKKIDKLD